MALYDVECMGRRDHDFYLELARELEVHDVADVGCGTGVLAVDLAEFCPNVTGIDPSAAMIDAARRRPGGDRVTWIEGYADALPRGSFDLVTMNGHVAQYFLSAADWEGVLRQIGDALRPGGYLAFEVRNPGARGWETWTEAKTRTEYPHPDGGAFESWSVSVGLAEDEAEGPLETHEGHSLLADGGHLVSEETLRFRPLDVLLRSLERGGLGNGILYMIYCGGIAAVSLYDSVGRIAFGQRVVSSSSQRWKSDAIIFARELPVGLLLASPTLFGLKVGLIGLLSVLPLLLLVDAVTCFGRDDHRSLRDLMFGTRVMAE